MPCSLVHGDFAERNVRIRRNGAGLKLLVFDWEVSGWGLSPVDLAHADLRLYWSLVRDAWSRLDFETLQRQVNLCKLLRGGIAATNWTVPSLTPEWVEGPIHDLIFYYARMTESLRALGWVP
jgi:aminoglycoside phosphotransferase (APT) family kinase protein